MDIITGRAPPPALSRVIALKGQSRASHGLGHPFFFYYCRGGVQSEKQSPDGLPGLWARSLLTVELWRRLNSRWADPGMACCCARRGLGTPQNQGAGLRLLA